jgi:hypothetical protein
MRPYFLKYKVYFVTFLSELILRYSYILISRQIVPIVNFFSVMLRDNMKIVTRLSCVTNNYWVPDHFNRFI